MFKKGGGAFDAERAPQKSEGQWIGLVIGLVNGFANFWQCVIAARTTKKRHTVATENGVRGPQEKG
jgi:hypothetical protein